MGLARRIPEIQNEDELKYSFGGVLLHIEPCYDPGFTAPVQRQRKSTTMELQATGSSFSD